LAIDSCSKVCTSCRSETVPTIAQNTTSVPADLTITISRVGNVTLNTAAGQSATEADIRCLPTSHVKVIAVQLTLHLFINLVFVYRLSIIPVIQKASSTVLVVYCVFMGFHFLWLVAIHTQYYQRRNIVVVLAMVSSVGLLLFRIGILSVVPIVFEVPVVSILSALAFIIDIETSIG
jgi:hypothetical protein